MNGQRGRIVLIVCALALGLGAVAASSASRPVKTYVGLTDWQRTHRGELLASEPSKIEISSRGVETIKLSGECGRYGQYSRTTLAPPIPIRNGRFTVNQPRNKISAHVTAKTITGRWAYFACVTTFTLKAKA